ncbi:MAG: hypothetical protein ACU843_14495 [Gammaproteobacteria bacterium]
MAITKKRLLGEMVGSLFKSGSGVKSSLLRFGLVLSTFYCSQLVAAIADLTVTDVTTRAFSVVWVADEEVTDAKVRVFDDNTGQNEITASLSITVVSASQPQAHLFGVVKVDGKGLSPDTDYFFDTETTLLSGVEVFPAPPAPLIGVRTALSTTKENSNGGPIVNDLIVHDIFAPDGTTPADWALMVVKAPGISIYPVSGFVGAGIGSPSTIVDLNNLFSDQSGTSAEVNSGTVLELAEFRGLVCSQAEQKLLRFRKAPPHLESPPITELEQSAKCFSADTVCDDTVNILDVQRVLNVLNETKGSCLFNSDLDIVVDDVINILDAQSVLNSFGQSAPFP